MCSILFTKHHKSIFYTYTFSKFDCTFITLWQCPWHIKATSKFTTQNAHAQITTSNDTRGKRETYFSHQYFPSLKPLCKLFWGDRVQFVPQQAMLWCFQLMLCMMKYVYTYCANSYFSKPLINIAFAAQWIRPVLENKNSMWQKWPLFTFCNY